MTSDIHIEHAHSLGVEQARATIETLIAKLKARYPKALHEIRWNQDRTAATLKGRGVKGSFVIGASSLRVSLTLGRLVRPFRSQAEHKIRDTLHRYFS